MIVLRSVSGCINCVWLITLYCRTSEFKGLDPQTYVYGCTPLFIPLVATRDQPLKGVLPVSTRERAKFLTTGNPCINSAFSVRQMHQDLLE